MKPLKWYPPTYLPDQDFDYPNENMDISVRVIVDWDWKGQPPEKQDMRFARYWWDHKMWCIDGVTGNVIIKRWIYIE